MLGKIKCDFWMFFNVSFLNELVVILDTLQEVLGPAGKIRGLGQASVTQRISGLLKLLFRPFDPRVDDFALFVVESTSPERHSQPIPFSPPFCQS